MYPKCTVVSESLQQRSGVKQRQFLTLYLHQRDSGRGSQSGRIWCTSCIGSRSGTRFPVPGLRVDCSDAVAHLATIALGEFLQDIVRIHEERGEIAMRVSVRARNR